MSSRLLSESLQRSLLTDPAQPEHLQLVARYLPAAREAYVGGDWYDSFELPDGDTMLVIGDVAGHDRLATASMAQVRGVLRGVAHSLDGSPGRRCSPASTTRCATWTSTRWRPRCWPGSNATCSVEPGRRPVDVHPDAALVERRSPAARPAAPGRHLRAAGQRAGAAARPAAGDGAHRPPSCRSSPA